MPDGPHNNLKLGWRWKRFVAASYNDAADASERGALASDALVREILTGGSRPLLAHLFDYAKRPQLDLEPESAVTNIFSRHPKAAFGDTFLREVAVRLWDRSAPETAVERALEAAVEDQIRKAESRIQDECIRAKECGEMRQDQFDCVVHSVSVAFDGLDRRAICDALREGDEDAFRDAASKKKGIEEGPGL